MKWEKHYNFLSFCLVFCSARNECKIKMKNSICISFVAVYQIKVSSTSSLLIDSIEYEEIIVPFFMLMHIPFASVLLKRNGLSKQNVYWSLKNTNLFCEIIISFLRNNSVFNVYWCSYILFALSLTSCIFLRFLVESTSHSEHEFFSIFFCRFSFFFDSCIFDKLNVVCCSDSIKMWLLWTWLALFSYFPFFFPLNFLTKRFSDEICKCHAWFLIVQCYEILPK